jgi:photosystem II stability/assembly factor-like uncharacterized protein
MKTLSVVLFVALQVAILSNSISAQEAVLTPNMIQLKSGVDASFRGLAVSGTKEAWATGTKGTVIRTTDAGKTWSRIDVPGSESLDFRDVEILPDGTVVLMSIGNGESSKILRSSDAGKTWKTVLVNKNEKGFFDGIAFDEHGRTGVLFGDPIEGRLDMYRTIDGGVSWTRLPNEQRPKLLPGEYGFAASGTGVELIGRNIWLATGGSVARVFYSANSGKTWSAYKTPISSGNESSGIFSIALVDKKRAVIIGGDYTRPALDRSNVATSADGGKTWSVNKSVRMPHKACVRSLGQARLIACGRTGVACSSDFGKTWKHITTDSYFTLAVDKESGTGLLAGKDGHVARFTWRKK